MAVYEQGEAPAATRARVSSTQAPVVIEARGLEKSFRVPKHRMDTFKERATHPFTRAEYRELHALRGVSFDVHKGEFFGIVGQNGSGKSTLLKILASIYRPDAGRIRMAGRLAPFIELGVGFNPELTARENSMISGVLMGLSKREAERRLDAVLEFAELEDFVEMKLKNYSSGMMVRLAFAVMVQADADIMLVDEVLAVGDFAFAEKCMQVFDGKRRQGDTVVLVSHDMGTVQSLCHRAMLIHDGRLDHIGDPEETAMRYYRLNFADAAAEQADEAAERVTEATVTSAMPDINARVVHAHLENSTGEGTDKFEQGDPIVLDAVLEAARELTSPTFLVQVMNADSIVVFGFKKYLDDQGDRLTSGQRVRLHGQIENSLVPGRYYVDVWIGQDRRAGNVAVQGLRLANFLVYGTAQRLGLVSVKTDVEILPEPAPGP